MSKEAKDSGKIQNQWLAIVRFRCSNGAGNGLRQVQLSFYTFSTLITSKHLLIRILEEHINIQCGLNGLGKYPLSYSRLLN